MKILRREFDLPEEDVEYLNANQYEWETIRTGGFWLLIHNFHIPDGYNVSSAKIAIDLTHYSPGPIDMVYVNPSLSRTDNKVINQVECIQLIDEIPFQRWSRHYTWDNDKCNLITHLFNIEEWFLREFSLR